MPRLYNFVLVVIATFLLCSMKYASYAEDAGAIAIHQSNKFKSLHNIDKRNAIRLSFDDLAVTKSSIDEAGI